MTYWTLGTISYRPGDGWEFTLLCLFFIFGFQNDPYRALNISEHAGKLSCGECSFTFIIMEFLESVYISNQTTACNSKLHQK